MMYLDANFFVLALLDTTGKGKSARDIHKAIVAGQPAITSSLTLDEVMWVFLKNKKEAVIREAIESIYATPNLAVKDVSSRVPLRALDFLEEGLKPRDAFHAAVMKANNVTTIVSDDHHFDRLAWIQRIAL